MGYKVYIKCWTCILFCSLISVTHTLVRNVEHVVLGNFLTNSHFFLIEGWSHVCLSVIITKKRNLSCAICSQAGYLGIGLKVLPGLLNLPPGSRQLLTPVPYVPSGSVTGGLREPGRPQWNLFSAYCLRKPHADGLVLIWGNRRKIIHGFKTWHFLSSHQICHVYYICSTSWPDFLKLSQAQDSGIILDISSQYGQERQRGRALSLVGKEMRALEMTRPRSKYRLQYWVITGSASCFLPLSSTLSSREMGIITGSQGWHRTTGQSSLCSACSGYKHVGQPIPSEELTEVALVRLFSPLRKLFSLTTVHLRGRISTNMSHSLWKGVSDHSPILPSSSVSSFTPPQAWHLL